MPDNRYKAEDIKVLEGLEAVRKRPAMYIGSTSKQGLHHLVLEVVSNAIDEAMAGVCDEINVKVTKDDKVSVKDNGRGIPVEIHPKTKVSTVETVLSRLHAGAKFSNKNFSGGLHGVGIAVVNALSANLIVEVKRDNYLYRQEYKEGKPLYPLKKVKEAKGTGTYIEFKPDSKIFKETTTFDTKIIRDYLKEQSYLNEGLLLTLEDEKTGKTYEFKSDKGLKEYIDIISKNKEPISDTIYIEDNKSKELPFKLALKFTRSTANEEVLSFANNIKTIAGGTHESGVKLAITKAFQEVYPLKKYEVLDGSDLREGLVAIISVKLHNAEFLGQTKTKLNNSFVKNALKDKIKPKLVKYFQLHREIRDQILDKAYKAHMAKKAAKNLRDSLRKQRQNKGLVLPHKLSDCQSKELTERELFIIEGDSAAGSAKLARNSKYQAVYPIKGKVLNVRKASSKKVLEDQVIMDLSKIIGLSLNKRLDPLENYSNLRYNKIIIMADADVDGKHIASLLLTFFYDYMPILIEIGRASCRERV